MGRSKRTSNASRRNDSTLKGDELIRHHLEEAIVHLRAAYQEMKHPQKGGKETLAINRMCGILKKIYIRHGGVDH